MQVDKLLKVLNNIASLLLHNPLKKQEPFNDKVQKVRDNANELKVTARRIEDAMSNDAYLKEHDGLQGVVNDLLITVANLNTGLDNTTIKRDEINLEILD